MDRERMTKGRGREGTRFSVLNQGVLSFFFVKLLFHMKDTKGTAPTGSQEAENKPFEISNLFIDGPPGASWKIILSARDREQLPEGVVVKKMTLEFWSLNVLLFSTQQLFWNYSSGRERKWKKNPSTTLWPESLGTLASKKMFFDLVLYCVSINCRVTQKFVKSCLLICLFLSEEDYFCGYFPDQSLRPVQATLFSLCDVLTVELLF